MAEKKLWSFGELRFHFRGKGIAIRLELALPAAVLVGLLSCH